MSHGRRPDVADRQPQLLTSGSALLPLQGHSQPVTKHSEGLSDHACRVFSGARRYDPTLGTFSLKVAPEPRPDWTLALQFKTSRAALLTSVFQVSDLPGT